MATLAMVKSFVEGRDLAVDLQQDIKEIEDSSLANRKQGWNDLDFGLENDAEFTDLFNNGYATGKAVVSKTEGDAEVYLKGITETVKNSSGRGDTDLMYGSSPATMWDNVVGTAPFSVTYQLLKEWVTVVVRIIVKRTKFTADWGSIPQTVIGKHTSKDKWDGSTTEYKTICASGTAEQWAPYVHLHGGDTSSLDADISMYC